MGHHAEFQQIQTIAQKIPSIDAVPASYRKFLDDYRPDFLTAETPFVGAGNSFERYKRTRTD